MGTRSTTHFIDDFFGENEVGQILATLYTQYDGNPEAHGIEMAEFLQGRVGSNGIGIDTTAFNGMGDLAVRLIAALKQSYGINNAGNYYLTPLGEDVGYVYRIYLRKNVEPLISVDNHPPLPASEFIAHVNAAAKEGHDHP